MEIDESNPQHQMSEIISKLIKYSHNVISYYFIEKQ